jgi:predicted permease
VTSVQWGASSVMLDMAPNARVTIFTALLSVAAAMLFGVVPAFRAANLPVARSVIGRGAVTDDGVSLRSGLVITQIAVTLALMSAAALFVRSMNNVRGEDLGFDRSRLLLAWMLPGYAEASKPIVLEKMTQIEQRVASLPGVVSVSASVTGVFSGSAGGSPRMRREGEANESAIFADDGRTVGPGFFRTTNQKMLNGREFTPADGDSSARVIILDASFARKMFGSADVVGRRLLVGGATAVPYEIVGVAADAKYGTPRGTRGMTVYTPYAQARNLRRMSLIVRTSGPTGALAGRVRAELAAIDPLLPVLDIDTVDEQMDRALFRERLVVQLATAFAAIALLLACLGLYGVMSFLTNRRSREIGVRMALGANQIDVVRMVLGQSLRLVVAGIVLGVGLTFATRKLIAAHMYGVSAGDPLTVGGVAVAFVAIAMVATYLPVRRAVRVSPVAALRVD